MTGTPRKPQPTTCSTSSRCVRPGMVVEGGRIQTWDRWRHWRGMRTSAEWGPALLFAYLPACVPSAMIRAPPTPPPHTPHAPHSHATPRHALTHAHVHPCTLLMCAAHGHGGPAHHHQLPVLHWTRVQGVRAQGAVGRTCGGCGRHTGASSWAGGEGRCCRAGIHAGIVGWAAQVGTAGDGAAHTFHEVPSSPTPPCSRFLPHTRTHAHQFFCTPAPTLSTPLPPGVRPRAGRHCQPAVPAAGHGAAAAAPGQGAGAAAQVPAGGRRTGSTGWGLAGSCGGSRNGAGGVAGWRLA
mgnify:CR=1 FL=1